MKPVVRWRYVRSEMIWSWHCKEPNLFWFARGPECECGIPPRSETVERQALNSIARHLMTGYPRSYAPETEQLVIN